MFQATPSLIIGLGGTGLKVASYVKKSLLEANQNELPARMAILVLDTEREIKFQAGGWGQERSKYHATGPVRIDVGEYIALTGNVLDKGQQLRNEQLAVASNPSVQRSQPHRHISSWFQARYYLDQAGVDDAVWNLDVGAGQFRQFGRLALYNNIDLVITKIKSALQAIKQMGPAATVYVHVTGSMAGGTGASLYVDVPHLVRQIARDVGFTQSPVILGHFVLGEAFRGTPQVKLSESGVKQQFDARTYAALRELTRLQGTVTQNVGGYPLVYDPHGVREKNAKLEKNLYSAVYLYDGQRASNALNIYPLEYGLAPAIADAIVAYVDDKSGGAFCSHSVNYQAFYSAYNIPTGQVTYGSVGTYTIELPIYHITEGWAHDLARQVLDTLLMPADFDKDSATPTALTPDQPGGKSAEPEENARRWLRESTTALVSQLAEWGQVAGRTTSQRQQVVDSILAMDATTWQQKLAPSDPRFQNYVNEAQAELQASLSDKESHKYYVDHNVPGGGPEQKADNLQLDVENKIRQMVGNMTDNWKREGGDFRRAMVLLGSHHVRSFEDSLLAWLNSTLNGGNVGTAIEKKQGKLGYAETMLKYVQKVLADSVAVLQYAEDDTKRKRIPVYRAMDEEVKNLAAKMRQNSGWFGGNLKDYRDKWDEIARFHKADIARQIVEDLVVRLHQAVNKLVDEIGIWKRALATAPLMHGGAYALVAKGQDEIAVDRGKADNAVNWVIANDEPADVYIQEKHGNYVHEQLESILDSIEWKLGREDGNRGLRIDFTLDGQNWDRRAGRSDQMVLGQRNVTGLLNRCRQPFDVAWNDMSVAAYLHRNYDHRPEELAALIYKKSGYLLSSSLQQPTMRTTVVRVFKEGLDTRQEQFLIRLRSEVGKLFQETTSAQQRAANVEGGKDYLNEAGQDSRDRFKLTFVLFGDLLLPDVIRGYKDAQVNYHTTSGSENKWRELHILPAETNSLEIERELSVGDHPQKRRELMDEIVTILEDRQRFHVAMRCLAYGETDYLWGVGQESGLLLHRHSPLQNNDLGHSYWRLTVEPIGRRGEDGRVYDQTGRLARPIHYQLTDMSGKPDLVNAFMQLCCRGADKRDSRPIDWERVEETLDNVMQKHKQQWSGELDQHWRFKDGLPGRLRDEAYDKAAQIIRLNALIEESSIKLSEHQWAWHPQQMPVPPRLVGNREGRRNVQQFVDLHSALQQAAHEDMQNLGERLGQLGRWLRNIPTARTTFGQSEAVESEENGEKTEAVGQPDLSNRAAVSQQDVAPEARIEHLPDHSKWGCENCQWQNFPDDSICGTCGKEKPDSSIVRQMPVTNGSQPVAPTAEVRSSSADGTPPSADKLTALTQAYQAGVLTKREYERKVAEMKAATQPAKRSTPELQQKSQALEQAYRAGIFSQQEYERRMAEMEAAVRPIDPELQQKLQALEQAYHAGIFSQQEYDQRVAELKAAAQPVDPVLQQKLQALEQAYHAGIFSQQEYDRRVAELRATAHLDQELQQKLQALEQAYHAGIFSQQEYDRRVAELKGVTPIDSERQRKQKALQQARDAGILSEEEYRHRRQELE